VTERTLKDHLLTPSDIGGVNRSRVLQAFCDYGPLSRAQLAKMAGVTRATIGNIVAGLIDSGLIEEGEALGTGKVGKPGRPLWFGPRAGLTGAVSITPGIVDAALVNARGELLDEAREEFDGVPLLKTVNDALERVLPKDRAELLGIGVAIPGVVDTSTGNILGSGPVPELRGTTLVDALSESFRLRVLVDNDSRAQALGEKWFGHGKQIPSFASVQTGHGIGVGLVLGGVVLRGPRGEGGEVGHTTVVLDGEKCRCGLHGCWETIATLGWLRREAKARGIKGASSLNAGELASRDDAKSGELLERYAHNIAVGLANLTEIFSPGVFILHGDAVGGGERFRAMIERATRGRVLAHMRRGVQVVGSELDQRATLLGAAGLMLSETFQLAV
jgi:predicted NBD/HSP70 family sugar kinase